MENFNNEELYLTVGGETFFGYHPTITQSIIDKQFMLLRQFEYNDFEDFITRERAFTCGKWEYYKNLDEDDKEVFLQGHYLVMENDKYLIRIRLEDTSKWIITHKHYDKPSIYKYWD